MMFLSRRQKPIKNPQNESFDEKNTGFIIKYRTKKNIHANAKKNSAMKKFEKNQWTP